MKCEDLSNELESSQRECRNNSSELFRLRAAWDETVEQLDSVRRENKNLADEIKDLLDQLGEGGRSIHELDKQRRRLQVEKDELQLALEEAESALEQEENKVLRSQMDLAQAKQEIERRYYTKQITKEYNTIFETISDCKKRKKNLKTLAKILLELWIRCRLLWKEK